MYLWMEPNRSGKLLNDDKQKNTHFGRRLWRFLRRFKNRKIDGAAVVLVTGAASGIGQAAALRIAEESAIIILPIFRRRPATRPPAKQAGGKAVFIRVDVSQPQDVEAAFRRIRELYGRLDCVCNNAGTDGDWADT
jgi:NADP-dependent 3-hydroxy acid dehydrogenase YdfG